ncbi:hypothetical protein DSM106972_007200 [Dulcicalothrix desertica PCC 7102]|uniref:DUF1822 domain-containing protein n=1 Tax=Dulcicalothrix desertica PCC 7102 TaxID=232991 RepID=A0A433VVW8_9CYAN|nr:DUF1822 family protein [Dulcicalothrix desertica]RUT10225.1 hypothetical protein DSM106972_007200 [Dulcicalothrix desertica PCC 7102]TWH40797.1 uncharacterized protein DUF1822 [Dulcicalothrix desertica PCC 7102]
MKKLSQSLTFSLPISAGAYRLAQKFRDYHTNPLKAKQVYFNTLAITVVKAYLNLMGIQVNWEDCLSYNPLTQTLLDVADLDVQGLGKIECRAIEMFEEAADTANNIISVPLEACLDRIGYVFVQINESLKTATILGFRKTIPDNGELPISELESLEDLLSLLSQPAEVNSESFISIPRINNLSQWFQNVFDIGWQTVESLLSLQQQTEIAYRSKSFNEISDNNLNTHSESQHESLSTTIERGKLFDLSQIKNEQIALLVELIHTCEEEIDIWVKVYPCGTRKNLPEELQLFVLDELGTVVMQATARNTENILLNFSSVLGECFSVKLTLNEVSFTEHFQV